MASRFKQQRVERNKRRRWEDRRQRRWASLSNAEDNNGGGRRWDDRDYKEVNAHERRLSCQRQPLSGRPRLQRGGTHTNEDYHAKGNVIGTTATTKEVERHERRLSCKGNRHRDDRDYTRGRTIRTKRIMSKVAAVE